MKKETKVIDINELKFDENNFNKHNEQGMELLEKSLRENGFGRSILLDKDNNIVGGNGVTEQAKKLGTTKVRVIETDGTEIIAVKRTDLTLDSERGRKMAFADNSVAHVNLQWNEEELQKAQDKWGLVLEEWGVISQTFIVRTPHDAVLWQILLCIHTQPDRSYSRYFKGGKSGGLLLCTLAVTGEVGKRRCEDVV